MSEYIGWLDDEWNTVLDHNQEIVRCRDCKHGHEVTWPAKSQIPQDYLNCSGYLVAIWDYYNDEPKDNPVPPDGFCAWGAKAVEE